MGIKITDTTLRDALALTPGPLSRERERGDRQVGVRVGKTHGCIVSPATRGNSPWA